MKTIFILMLLVIISSSMVLATNDYVISLFSDQPTVTFNIKTVDHGQEEFSLNVGESKAVLGNTFNLMDKTDDEYKFEYVGNIESLRVGETLTVSEKSQQEVESCQVTLLDLINENQAKLSINGEILNLEEGETKKTNNDCEVTLVFLNENEAKVQVNGNMYGLKEGETINPDLSNVPPEVSCEAVLVHQETNRVKLSVNGEMIDLEEGQTKKMSNGCEVTLVLLNENEVKAQINGKMISLKESNSEKYNLGIKENDFKQKFIMLIGDDNSKSVVNEINLLTKIQQSNNLYGVISGYELLKVRRFLLAKAFSGELNGKVLFVAYPTKIEAFGFGNYDSSLVNSAKEFASENKLSFKLYKDDYSQLGISKEDSENFNSNENINKDQNENQSNDVNSNEQQNEQSNVDSNTPSESVCDGCLKEGVCLPIGTRVANGESKYCDYDKELKLQKVDDSSCQNNYECVSNQCLNAKCVSLEKQVEETKGIIQSFINWIKGIFS